MLAGLPERDRIAEQARDGRGLAVIWEMSDQMRKRIALHTVMVLMLGLLSGSLFADDSQQLYEAMFGEEEKEVSQTRDPKIKAAFAAKLLKSARDVPGPLKFKALLCEKAYDIAVDGHDYAATVDAMKLLASVTPDKRPEAEEKLLKLYERQYASTKGITKKEAGAVLLTHLVAMADARAGRGAPTEAVKLYTRALEVAQFLELPDMKEIEAKKKTALDNEKIEKEIAQLEKYLKEDPPKLFTAEVMLYEHQVAGDRGGRPCEVGFVD
ncbi:MAG TPA: hypothetical protein VMW24_14105 [Sedimentisphaerales bacterium]|nr:hypothetical protein [Sedimentisphaerales bacterium]